MIDACVDTKVQQPREHRPVTPVRALRRTSIGLCPLGGQEPTPARREQCQQSSGRLRHGFGMTLAQPNRGTSSVAAAARYHDQMRNSVLTPISNQL